MVFPMYPISVLGGLIGRQTVIVIWYFRYFDHTVILIEAPFIQTDLKIVRIRIWSITLKILWNSDFQWRLSKIKSTSHEAMNVLLHISHKTLHRYCWNSVKETYTKYFYHLWLRMSEPNSHKAIKGFYVMSINHSTEILET